MIESVPGAPNVNLAAFTLAFGASRAEPVGEVHSVTIPLACAMDGFEWGAEAGFSDGTSVLTTFRSPCPPAATRILGQRQAVNVTTGKVSVRLGGSTTFVPLSGEGTIPNGSELDTTEGSVLVTAATVTPGQSESAEVHGGRFVVQQDSTGSGETHLILSQPLTGCSHVALSHGSASAIATGAAHRSGSKSRHLWVSDGGGSWGTSGRYVSTTVEGTRWLTLDECNRSVVRVAAGKVKVHDLIHHTITTLTMGKRYVAAPSPKPRRR